jgi:tRNA(Ile)-lysidine synthase
VLPLLQTLNPAVSDNVQRTTENLMEAQKVLDGIVESYKNRNVLDLNDLEKYGSSEYIVFEWLRGYGFNGSQTAQIMEAETGRVFTSTSGYDVLKDRNRIIVEPSLKPMRKLRIPEEGTYVLDENVQIRVQKCAVYVSKELGVATLDAAKVCFPLIVRRVEDGDWMIPYGMKGRKLLSDLMTDCKMTLFEKRRQLVVVDAQGIIVWVPGLRSDARVAVTETTTEVLELRFG